MRVLSLVYSGRQLLWGICMLLSTEAILQYWGISNTYHRVYLVYTTSYRNMVTPAPLIYTKP